MDERAARLIDYLGRQVIRRPGVTIAPDTPLVSSGLIDSFALVEILLELEKVTQRRIPAGRVSPEDMDTVEKMLQTADRVGKPKV